MLYKLIKKLFKLPELPEPKGILKIVKNIPAKRLDVQYKLDNGEIINVTVSGATREINQLNPLDLGYKRVKPLKFLGLLDQYGLSDSQYNKKYLYNAMCKVYFEPSKEACVDFNNDQSVVAEISPGTTIGFNPDRIRSIQAVENYSGAVEIFEHKVKEE